MISEAMLVADITGAGSVLAVCALAAGKASEILSNKAQSWIGALV